MRRFFVGRFVLGAAVTVGACAFACTAPYGEHASERLETSPVKDDAGGGSEEDVTTTPVPGDEDGGPTVPPDANDAGDDAEPPPIVPQCDRNKPFGTPVRLGGGVNTTGDGDSDARLSADEKQIVFTSDRGSAKRARVWTASRASASADFGPATVLLEDPTEPLYDATLSPSGLVVVFQAGGLSTAARLRVAVRAATNAPFGGLIDLVGANANGGDERDPSFTPDGRRLVFSRGSSAYDLFSATSTDQKTVTNVTALTELNSTASERDPVLTQEGLEIFFSSDRAAAGKMRIYHAKRKSTSAPFGAPSLVTVLDGTLQYDAPTWTSPDGCVLYFSSDRSSTSIDVWRAQRPK